MNTNCPRSFAHAYTEHGDVCVWCGQQRSTPPTESVEPPTKSVEPPTESVEPPVPTTYAGYAPVLPSLDQSLEPVLGRNPEQSAPPVIEAVTVQDNGLVTGGFVTVDTFDATEPVQRAPVDELLRAALPWYTSGGSPMGWSKLKTAKLCLRSFFFAHVLKLRPKFEPRQDDGKERVNALELGTLVHTCIEAFYRTADVSQAMAPAMAVQAQYPVLALEAVRLTNFYLRRFNSYEAQHWDIRAVERESRFFFPPRKCAGKRRRLLVSARHDHIYRHLQPGERRLPPGTPGLNVRIAELKTTSTLTSARLRGFFQNAQLMTGLLGYNYGHAVTRDGLVLPQSNADLLGATDTVTVTWIGKAKRADVDKDIDRVDYVIPLERVQRFADELVDWYYDEIGERIFHKCWLDPETWQKDWTCTDVHWQGWVCPYVSLCESTSPVDYGTLFDVGSPFDRDVLEMPKKLEKQNVASKGAVARVEAK